MKILRFFGVFIVLICMNLGTAFAAGTSIAGFGTLGDPVCDDTGCTYCDDTQCYVCDENLNGCRGACSVNQYGTGNVTNGTVDCHPCPDTYPKSYLGTSGYSSPFNLYENQCFNVNACSGNIPSCEQLSSNSWQTYFGSAYSTYAPVLFSKDKIKFKMLNISSDCDVKTNYCTYELKNQKTGRHTAVQFKNKDGELIDTYYVVYNGVWSTQNTTLNDTVSNSSVVYPTFVTPSAPSILGKRFIGWYDAQTGGSEIIEPASTGALYGNLTYDLASTYVAGTSRTLYARYEDVAQPTWIAITLDDKNNGTNPTTASNPTVLYKNTNSAVSNCSGYRTSQSCRGTEITSITIPTLTGYTYGGHYTQSGGNGTQFIKNNGIISTDYSPTTSITVYAKWTQNTPTIYTVRLNSNGDSDDHIIWYINGNYYCDSSATQIINLNDSVFTKCDFGAPTGNSGPFNGYVTQQMNGDRTIADNGNIILRTVTADTTWYAQYGECEEGQEWDTEKSECVEVKPTWVTVRLNDNAANTASDPTRLYLNTNANVTNCSGYRTAENCSDEYIVTRLTTRPTKDGYTYQGHWISLGAQQLISSGGSINQNILVTEDTEVIAEWLGNCNEVKFDDNNTSDVSVNSENMQHKTSGDSAWKDSFCKSQSTPTTLNIPSNDHARFLGYYTGEGTPIFDNTGNVTSEGNAWTIYAPATLYAHWECEDDYTWNDSTKTCDKLYYVYCEDNNNANYPLASGTQREHYDIHETTAEINKFCNTTCETDYTWDGNFDLYIDGTTMSNNSPVNIGPSGTLSGEFYNTYHENSYVILRPHCVQTTTSVKYLCYIGDTNGWTDNDVSLTDYTVKGVESYVRCAINNNNPMQDYYWTFSGDDGLYAPGDPITPWNYGADKTFTPTYTASFTCENGEVWGGTAPANANVQLGEQYTLPNMPCTLNTDFNGWVETNGDWEFERFQTLVSPISDATCNATNGAVQFSGGHPFTWNCPENIQFRPMIKLIKKYIEVSCGTGGATETFLMTHENQNTIQQDIIDWYATACTGHCPLTNLESYPQGYNNKLVCVDEESNLQWPAGWTQADAPDGSVCYLTPENLTINEVLTAINMSQINNLNISNVTHCPQRITYKCSQDATDVYDEAPYAVYNKPYTTLPPETVGCGDTGLGFNNWQVAIDGAEYSENVTVSEWPYDDEVTLVAQWGDANTYRITYYNMQNAVYGTGSHPTSYTHGTVTTIDDVPTLTNARFIGWCTDAELNNCAMTQTISATETGNKEFWAKWECNHPYHLSPNNDSCDSCGPNLYWNGIECESCGSAYPFSTPPFNWSEDQCWNYCDTVTCNPMNGISQMFGCLPTLISDQGKQIKFKGNEESGVHACDSETVPYCPYGLQCSSENEAMPRYAMVDFYHGTDLSQHDNRYILGNGTYDDSTQSGIMYTVGMWGAIMGPAQNMTSNPETHNEYTFIWYPSDMAPDATVDGYNFTGYYHPRNGTTWYVDASYELNATNAQSVITSISNVIPGATNTRDLYAQYSPITYPVRYDCGGHGTGASDNVTYGTSYTVKTASGANCGWAGHTFNGWVLNDSNQTQYAGGEVINPWTYTISNPIFTAQWSDANTYQITYTPGYEPSGQSDVTQDVVYGANFMTKGATTFTRPGYVMTAWQEPFPALSTEYVYNIAGNTTLEAQWDKCDAGTQPNTNNDQCEPCQGGTYGPNGISCEQCPDGYAQSAPGATAIEQCYTDCTMQCTEGVCPDNATCTWTTTYTNGIQYYGNSCNAPSSTCVIDIITCDAGYFLNETGTACEPCPDGTTSPAGATNVSQCSACPDGQYIDNETCTNCPDGFNHSDANASSVNQCYHDCETECTNPTCPANATSCEYGVNPASGAWYYGETACNADPLQCPITYIYCEPGFGYNATNHTCDPCTGNSVSVNNSCEPCDPGYAPNTDHTACDPITYTITYNPNGAPNSSPQTRPATYNQTFFTLGAIFTRPGYEMTAWSAPFPIMEYEYTYTRTQDTVLDAQWRICQAGEYWESGECEPCPEHYSSNPGAIGIDACFLSSCDDPNQHLFQGQCEDNEIECTAPNATYAIRTWNPALTAYGSCQIQECEVGYHIASNACVLDEQTCNVPNGRGERQWTGTQWGDCFVTQCNPGFEPNNAYTECRECDNRRVDGEIAVSSYASGCEIATCMYHGQKYILEGNECHPICNRPDDETGHMEWNESTKKCVRTCNQGYKMW